MKITVMNRVKASVLIALGVTVAVMGVYVADVDDAPGAAAMGLGLMLAGVVLGVQAARGRLPKWTARTALIVGVAATAFAAILTHGVMMAAPLFPPPQEVPSVVASAPARQYTAAVEHARQLARAAVRDQNLPGVSVAVGVSSPSAASAKENPIVWAEGFGWRDADTQTPVTPNTRFNIGTAAAAVIASVKPLGLTNTGAEPAAAWSPEHVGEPEEDFPPLAFLRHHIWQPLGLMAPEYPLPGDRATFYVPTADHDPRHGRRLMAMRDLACCANGQAFYSTPSDLVRVALATHPGSLNGDLAGGMVMSVLTTRDTGLVVAVTSNIAYADTSSVAQRVADAFAGRAR